MANLDFKSEVGRENGTKLVKELFHDFEKVETAFTDYNIMTVTVDDVFDFRFNEDDLLQTKRLLTLLELKKLDKLSSEKKAVAVEQSTARTILQDLYDKCYEEKNEHTLTVDSKDILNLAKYYGVAIDE